MSVFRVRKEFILSCLLVVFLAGYAISIQAQSLDARFPSPVRSNEIVGRIGARDLGDARLTDHFYAFTGTPGDLLITIETRNLNGDVDIFTAGALRPVLKLAIYAEVTAPVTKSIYLRHREDLILRVEARSPNDDDGTYHLRFGGSFEPIAAIGNDEKGSGEIATALPAARKGKRVSSVGARIEEPAPPALEVAEAPTPEPSPSDLVDPPPVEPRPAEPTPVEPKAEIVVEAPPTSTGQNPRTRASTRRGRGRAAPKEETAKKPVTEEIRTEAEPSELEASKRDPVAEISDKPAVPTKKTKKSRSVTTEPVERPETASNESTPATGELATAKPSSERRRTRPSDEATTPAQPEDLSKSKLIIEMLDGTLIERFMNTVRRVDVENGQIVVTGTDGTVQRIRLARVVRMSIGQ